MPSFPTYSQPTQKTAPLPDVRYSPAVPAGAFGVEFGMTLQQSGALMARRVTEMAEENDRLFAVDALSRATREADLYLYGSDDAPGALNLEGEGALGAGSRAVHQLASIGNRFAADLDGRSRAIFESEWRGKSDTYVRTVARHESSQRSVFRDATVKSALQSAVDQIQRDPLNPDVVDVAILGAFNSMQSLGKPDDFIREKIDALSHLADDEQIGALRSVDPIMVANLLRAEDGPWSDRSPEWLDIQHQRAIARYRSDLTARETEARIAREREKREEKAISDAAWSEGKLLALSGGLTADWIRENADRLGADRTGRLVDSITSGEGSQVDPGLYVSLKEQGREGDIEEEVNDAIVSHGMSITVGERLLKESKDYRFGAAEDLLTRYLKPSEMNADPLAPGRYADAMFEFGEYMRADPEATSEDAEKKARQIIGSTMYYDAQRIVAQGKRPTHLVGTRKDPDLDETKRITVEAYLEKHGGDIQKIEADPGYREEMARIQRWERAMEMIATASEVSSGK